MQTEQESKNCLICGTVFYRKQNKSLKEWNNIAKYCSRRCSAISIREVTIARNKAGAGKSLTEEHRNKLKIARIGRKPSLGIKHSEETRELIRKKVKEAQTPEVRLKKSLAHRGEKSHNWKGGRMSLKHRMRTNTKYVTWRTDVFIRDKYTCIWCGDSRGGNLQADHIIEVATIFDNFNLKTIDEIIDCSALWDISNGRTLCKTCHIKRHNVVV